MGYLFNGMSCRAHTAPHWHRVGASENDSDYALCESHLPRQTVMRALGVFSSCAPQTQVVPGTQVGLFLYSLTKWLNNMLT